MASKLPPIAPPAPQPSTPHSGQQVPYFRPSISLSPPQPPRLSISNPPPPLNPSVIDKDHQGLSQLPEIPPTPAHQSPPPLPMSTIQPAGTPGQGVSTTPGLPEVGVLHMTVLSDTSENVQDALDKFEGFRHMFDMAVQTFRLEKDINAVNVYLAKVQEFLASPEFELLLATTVDIEASKTAKGFKLAYTKEIEHVGKYLQEQCEVITQMLKLFISTPPDKLSGQKDALTKVLEEARTITRHQGATIKDEFIKQAGELLSTIELQDGLLTQIQQSTTTKDYEKLENLLARATAAGFTDKNTPIVADAQKIFTEHTKQQAKKSKTLKKGEVLPPSEFYNLTSVVENASFFVGLNSILPLKQDYKVIPKDKLIPTADNPLPGIDTSVAGVDSIPNLSFFMDQFVRLPLILYDCLQFIRYSFGWREEGLFRLSGNNETIANALIKYEVQHATCVKNGGYIAGEQGFLRPIYTGPFTDVHPTLLIQLFTSPHDATNVMKRWLRSLIEPIVPFDSYKSWADVVSIPHTVNDTTKVDLITDITTSPKLQKIHELIELLPPDNKGILMYLSLYLYVVSLNHGVSKMTAENLSIVVAPNILRTKEEPKEQSSNPVSMLMAMRSSNNDLLNQSKVVNEIITLVIRYAPVLFAPINKE